ncbi:MAG: hypothetical protein IPM53_25040 [Anaerolineaceae bacterium]|nr:hypothetical protein [Anaerolineaceae bacterium]
MSISVTPPPLMSAVVQHLKTTRHLQILVETNPDRDAEYRLICLTLHVADAERLAHLLQGVDDGRYGYSVCLAETVPTQSVLPPGSLPSTV